MITIVTAMFFFAFIGAASPGPVNIIATSSSAMFGFKRTLPHVLGASISYAVIVYTVGIGLGELLLTLPEITETLQYLSAAFLLYMAYKIASTKVQSQQASLLEQQAPSLIQGALVQGLNPKAWLVSISGVSIFVSANEPTEIYLWIFTSLSFIVCFIGIGIWAVFGQLLSKLLHKPSHQTTFNRLIALLLTLSVVLMFI